MRSVEGAPDLVLTGARLVDRARGLDGSRRWDVEIADGVIRDIKPAGRGTRSCPVLHCSETSLVTPAWIDAHTHVLPATGASTLRAADLHRVGVAAGVGTVVDGGSLGVDQVADIERSAAATGETTLLAFANVSTRAHRAHDHGDFDSMSDLGDFTGAKSTTIVGVKLRIVGEVAAQHGIELVEHAQAVARRRGLPLMVHLGDRHAEASPERHEALAATARYVVRALARGDIITHACSPWAGSLQRSRLIGSTELADARTRGVVLDLAMGRNHFSADVFRELLAHGEPPQSLSTDMDALGLGAHSLAVDMSKVRALGLEWTQIAEMVSHGPARMLGLRDGGIAVGCAGDLTVAEVRDEPWNFTDPVGRTVACGERLVPVAVVIGGRIHGCADAPASEGE